MLNDFYLPVRGKMVVTVDEGEVVASGEGDYSMYFPVSRITESVLKQAWTDSR